MTDHLEQKNERLFSIRLRAMGRCKSCGKPMPLQGLLSKLSCSSCGWSQTISPRQWAHLLEEAMQQDPWAPPHWSDEGSAHSDSWPLELNWKRVVPIDPQTKDYPDLNQVVTLVEQGATKLPDMQMFSLRPCPPEFADHLLAVRCIVEQDPEGAQDDKQDSSEAEIEPLQSTCQGCGSPLTIDGSSKTLVCPFCGTTSVVPPDTWAHFHPTTKAQQWFLVLDARMSPVDWNDYSLQDVLAGSQGRLFLMIWAEEPDSGDRFSILVGMGPDRRALWFRRFPSQSIDPFEQRGTLLVSLGDDRIGVWTDYPQRLEILSQKDGSLLDVWTCRPSSAGEQAQDADQNMDLSRVLSLSQAKDGTLLAWYRQGEGMQEGPFALKRFDETGKPLARIDSKPKTPSVEAKRGEPDQPKRSWFSRLFGGREHTQSQDEQDAPPQQQENQVHFRLEEGLDLGLLDDSGITPLPGPDGDVFLVSQAGIGRYRADGRQVYFVKVDHMRWDFRQAAFVDEHGTIYVPGYDSDGDEAVLALDASGKTRIHAESRSQGGPVRTGSRMALARDGTLHLLGPEGQWTIMDSKGSILSNWTSAFDRTN